MDTYVVEESMEKVICEEIVEAMTGKFRKGNRTIENKLGDDNSKCYNWE